MNTKVVCAVTALAAAALFGSEVLCLVTLFDWAVLQQFGLGSDALTYGALSAVPPSLAVAVWIARSAYSTEMEHAQGTPQD